MDVVVAGDFHKLEPLEEGRVASCGRSKQHCLPRPAASQWARAAPRDPTVFMAPWGLRPPSDLDHLEL